MNKDQEKELREEDQIENKVVNIQDRNADYSDIRKKSFRAEHGIRSICVMYDEHSSDERSKENIFTLKNNVHYRVFSLAHQYLVFLRELNYAEKHLQDLHQKTPKLFNSFLIGNPYFEQVELEISSVFDSIVFQLSSMFDYISHLICYICRSDKTKTVYWTKLASSAYGKNNEFSNLEIKETIKEINSSFVGRLYDYRSRLLHKKKDEHVFKTSMTLNDYSFDLQILASDTALKNFKTIRDEFPKGKITLTFLSSWLIKRSFVEIEKILDSLRDEILKSSQFQDNLRKPKGGKGFMIVSFDQKTNSAKPISEGLWKQYKRMKGDEVNKNELK